MFVAESATTLGDLPDFSGVGHSRDYLSDFCLLLTICAHIVITNIEIFRQNTHHMIIRYAVNL